MIKEKSLFREYDEEFIERWTTIFGRASIAIKQLLKEYDELNKARGGIIKYPNTDEEEEWVRIR